MILERSSLSAAELCGSNADFTKTLISMSCHCVICIPKGRSLMCVTCASFYNEQVECIYVYDPKVRLLKMHNENFLLVVCKVMIGSFYGDEF
jgi:hypothetical protein